MPIAATVAVMVGGLFYAMVWCAIRHSGAWVTPPDLWNSATSAQALIHGNFVGVYGPNATLISPPGLEWSLAPLLAFGNALGLTSLPSGGTGDPTMWYLLGPGALLVASSALFALDAAARHYSLSRWRRIALALACGFAVVDATAFWGHPEDCAALGLVIWGALAMDGDQPGRTARAGWLFGVAVALQPLALLGIVPVFARVRVQEVPTLLVRLVVPSLLVLAPELITDGHHVLFILIHQPAYLYGDNPTPFSRLAPHLTSVEVAGGPTRLLSTAFAAILGFAVCRRRSDLTTVLATCALTFALRVVFETELIGYYFWPIVALCLLLALRRSWARFWICMVAASVNVVLGNYTVRSAGLWWPTMMVTTLIMLVLAIVPIEHRSSVEHADMDSLELAIKCE